MKAYLVINNSKDVLLKFAEQYQVFSKPDDALNAAVKAGFEDPFGMGVNSTIGILTTHKCGEKDVSIMPIEVK